MLLPLYLLVVNAFKSQTEIITSPFGLPLSQMTTRYIVQQFHSPDYNLIRAYIVTACFVIIVNIAAVVVTAPVAYVIARGRSWVCTALFIYFIAGTFTPGTVLLIPAVYVLRDIHLIRTAPGFLLFETAQFIPFSVFLYTAYIKSIPRDLDQAAAVDGAGRVRTFWRIIFPLMKPAVGTAVIITSIGVWNDFVDPSVILGYGSGLYTVTTGIYAGLEVNATIYTQVFPSLLLAVLPALVFFVFMQRRIIGGLASGATKG
jgi:raffinose/stachyose/melibiose transport system permease protein